MSLRVIIPLKPFDEGKSRLASVLDAAQRHALCVALAQRAFAAAIDLVGAANCLVVSRSAEALTLAGARNMRTLAEPAGLDLNQALQLGVDQAQRAGADRVLLLSADLPYVSESELRGMLALADPYAIAPDRARSGTNALLAPALPDLPLRYGADSFEQHLKAFAQRGYVLAVHESEALGFDIDAPEDYTAIV